MKTKQEIEKGLKEMDTRKKSYLLEMELKVCRETLQNLASLSSLLIIAERQDLNEKCDQAWELLKEIRAKLKGL